eukprot:m.951137 g.951137  ORF g.951137 m.951137 type:complete len:899 (-) comp23863_c0_seq1:429-3125(-)
MRSLFLPLFVGSFITPVPAILTCMISPNATGYLETPAAVTTIGAMSFQNCTTLQTLVVSPSVTTIGDYAFQFCPRLASVYLPSSVVSIGNGAFPSCLGFGLLLSDGHINFPRGNVECIPCAGRTTLTIPSSVTSISYSAFIGCTSITSVYIPPSVVAIGPGPVFPACFGFGLQTSSDFSPHGHVSCLACAGVAHISVPSNVTAVDSDAFSECFDIVSVRLPNSVTTIGGGAFSRCVSLQTINIPSQVTVLSIGVFFDCHSLESILLPEGTTMIDNEAFQNCTSLQQIVIPASVQYIGSQAFENLASLKSFTIEAPVATLGHNIFGEEFECASWLEFVVNPSYAGTLTCAHWEASATSSTGLALLNVSCASNQFLAGMPTPQMNDDDTIDGFTDGWDCQFLAQCNHSDEYEAQTPTATTDRVCVQTTKCTALLQYEIADVTATSDRVCATVTTCSNAEFRSAIATSSTDARCLPLSVCGANEHTKTGPTMSTNRVCVKTVTSFDAFAISLAGMVVVLLVVYVVSCTMRKQKRMQGALSDQEHLLMETETQKSEALETVQRMMAAWQIPEEHVVFEKRVADGSFGDVWAGRWGNHAVAIKVLKASIEDSFDTGVAEDFQRECKTLQSIRHPNLLIFYGAGTTSQDRKPFMVTEFMALGSLRKVLHNRLQHLFPRQQRIQCAVEIGRGMQHLHSLSIVHRDLKSDNVLLDEHYTAKVADFGNSRLVAVAQRKRDSTLELHTTAEAHFSGDGYAGSNGSRAVASMTKGVGTLLWMAPELLLGGSLYGPEVDVYSFGIILWELITREDPWSDLVPADTGYLEFCEALNSALASNVRPHVPLTTPDFDASVLEEQAYVQIMQGCWSSNPSARPSFASMVASMERSVLGISSDTSDAAQYQYAAS